MEPNLSRTNGLSFKSKLSESEIIEMRDQVRKNFGQIQIILKQVPSYMLFVLR